MEGCVDGVPRDSDNGQVRLWISGISYLSNGSANGIPIEVASSQRLVHDDHRLRTPLIGNREVAASNDGNAIRGKPLRTDLVLQNASVLSRTRRQTYRFQDSDFRMRTRTIAVELLNKVGTSCEVAVKAG